MSDEVGQTEAKLMEYWSDISDEGKEIRVKDDPGYPTQRIELLQTPLGKIEQTWTPTPNPRLHPLMSQPLGAAWVQHGIDGALICWRRRYPFRMH